MNALNFKCTKCGKYEDDLENGICINCEGNYNQNYTKEQQEEFEKYEREMELAYSEFEESHSYQNEIDELRRAEEEYNYDLDDAYYGMWGNRFI